MNTHLLTHVDCIVFLINETVVVSTEENGSWDDIEKWTVLNVQQSDLRGMISTNRKCFILRT